MKCPKCGEELSSATKICPCCGLVIDDKMDDWLNELEVSLMNLKTIAPVSFGTYFSSNAYLMYGIVTVVMLIVTFLTGGNLFLLIAGLFLILMIVSLVRKFIDRKKNQESESAFREAMVETETIMRVLKNDYFESKAVRERLESTTSELKDIVYSHNKNRRHAIVVWCIVMAATLIVSVAGIMLLGSRDSGAEETVTDTETSEMITYKD